MLDDLLLLSGNDIPFIEAQIGIHQPTIKEIAYIGEENFTGCELLNFSKDLLNEKDKKSLENRNNFEIFMSIMREKNNPVLAKNKVGAKMVLALLFPEYQIHFNVNELLLIRDGEPPHSINEKNFEIFKEILVQMFCLKQSGDGQSYNPGSKRAAEIAEKLARGRAKAAAAKGETQKISILSRYVSILAVGIEISINSLMQYTVYQLFDEFERYQLKVEYDLFIRAKLAGAKDVKEVDHWMKEIH